jgi:hypothetical protein
MKHPLFAALAYTFIALFTLSSPEAFGRGFGELGLHLSTERSEDAGNAASVAQSERHFRFDIATGWQSMLSETHFVSYGLVFKSERGLQNSSDLTGYGLGAFAAWFRGPFSVRLDYLLIAELKSNSGVAETQYREGRGLSFEARWLHSLTWLQGNEIGDAGSKFAIGPAVVFTQIKYGKTRVGSLPEASATRVTESLSPGLRAVFMY